jgi:cysteine-rich repeat protein
VRALIISLVAVAGCVASDSVECGNGLICPQGTTCTQLTIPAEMICATSKQLEPCAGAADGDACVIEGIVEARCYDGVCQDGGCGNNRIEDVEVCDDGNKASGDGCSADCKSTEQCGNLRIDDKVFETCDDGNHVDHDGCSSTCQAEQLRWRRRALHPPARTHAAMAYDPVRDRVVMFSGDEFISAVKYSDTWEWDGVSWVEVDGPAPAARIESAMAFDGTGVLLYGGDVFTDTWRFDGASWTQLAVTGPTAHRDHSMAYDSRRKRIVLFGGATAAGGTLDETWEWDGTAWSKIATATKPPGRWKPMLAYDPVHGVIVLAGGENQDGGGAGTCDPQCGDTWTYDGVDWTNVTPSSGLVPKTSYYEMAFDTGSQRVVAFGGAATDPVLAWNGASWTDVTPALSPSHTIDETAVATRSSILMFGTGSNELWIFEAGAWRQATTAGSFQIQPFANDLARNTLVDLDAASNTWTLSSAGGWRKVATGGPPVRYLTSTTYDPLTRTVLKFGGVSAGGVVDDATWTWDGTAWTLRTPGLSPTARQGAAIAFDGVHLTLFGGTASPGFPVTPLGDTWHWDGMTWALASPATSPPAMTGACAGYDPVRDEMVLFGSGGTWTYDGVTWTKKTPPNAPAVRANVPLVWNASRQRLVLGGGEGSIDIWEWDGSSWEQFPISGAPPARLSAGYAASLDGQGIVFYGGIGGMTFYEELWELRWNGPGADERCDGSDVDADGLVSCADGDCWQSCSPACPPGTSCPAGGPTCGDAICDPVFETCQTCAMDCDCGTRCGDFLCGAGEVCPGDCP